MIILKNRGLILRLEQPIINVRDDQPWAHMEPLKVLLTLLSVLQLIFQPGCCKVCQGCMKKTLGYIKKTAP